MLLRVALLQPNDAVVVDRGSSYLKPIQNWKVTKKNFLFFGNSDLARNSLESLWPWQL